MIDILICSVPAGIINRPPAAPALLKACVVAAGYTAKTQDFSLMLYTDHCNKNYESFTEVNNLFESFAVWEDSDIIKRWLDQCIQEITSVDPKYLAISVFSFAQHRATVLLCEAVRQCLPKIKIILGGYGLTEPYTHSFQNFRPLSAVDHLSKFDRYVTVNNLADHCITGEGEQQLVDLLNGNVPSTDLVELDHVPFSNFDDYHLDQYLWHTEPVLLVTGSKGCVRKCTFCNVPGKFGRFRKKTGSRIAEEMIFLSQQYNIYKFEFTDSLVNGSLKEFEEFVTVLADYNDTAEHPITWYGQYICRPQSQVPSHIYHTMKRSGAVHLIIGAESGSDAVLEAMNKRVTVSDLFNELDQFEKHGLQAQLLVLGSFINETWPRFLETLTFIANCQRYLAAGVVSRIAAGLPLIIEPDGYLHVNANELGIIIDEHNSSNWKVIDDPTNTWLERLRRRLIMQALLQTMQVSMTGNGISELSYMAKQLEVYEQQLRSPNTSRNSRMFAAGAH